MSPSPVFGTALITGGTSGMGLEFARALAARGLDLVLVARNAARLESAAKDLTTFAAEAGQQISVSTISADLATADGVAAVKDRLLAGAAEAPITVFVNNAGAGLYAPMVTDDATELLSAAQLMALAPMELGGAAAFAMKARGRGVIINTASMSAVAPMGAYSAIKGFVRTWSDSLAAQVGRYGVQVVTFMPGWVRTEFHQRSGVSTSSIPSFLWLDATRVVSECLRDVDAGKTTSIPSKRYKVLNALAKHAPASAVNAVVRKLNKGRR